MSDPHCRIQKLSDSVINQIAAGEVIDRPASIVKELMENSLDAGADFLSLEVDAEQESLRIVDNGSGMTREEVLLAIERHATSKISRFEELSFCQTFGFRGEALPSIASVSTLILKTMRDGEVEGTVVEIDHGDVKSIHHCGLSTGTDIQVLDLFGKVPARRKYLKKPTTEFSHIVQVFRSFALARPDVHFSLKRGDEELFNWRPQPEAERVWQVLADDIQRKSPHLSYDERRAQMVPFKSRDGSFSIRGYLGSAQLSSSTSKSFHLFVNGRAVWDARIRKAVTHGYGSLIDARKFPLAVLFLEVPGDFVDVNVHPSKKEVRFVDGSKVYRTVYHAVSEAIGDHHWLNKPADFSSFAVPRFESSRFDSGPLVAREESFPLLGEANFERSSSFVESFSYSNLTVIGQAKARYILCEGAHELFILDQHAAHERVVFEDLLSQWNGSKELSLASQLLVTPFICDLSLDQWARYQEKKELLAQIGFDIEPLSGNSLSVRGVPQSLAERNVTSFLIDLFNREDALGPGETKKGMIRPILATMACHSSARFGDYLEMKELTSLLQDLSRVGEPTRCPHGRPIRIDLPFADLERRLGR